VLSCLEPSLIGSLAGTGRFKCLSSGMSRAATDGVGLYTLLSWDVDMRMNFFNT
jgi:hypothetical protein